MQTVSVAQPAPSVRQLTPQEAARQRMAYNLYLYFPGDLKRTINRSVRHSNAVTGAELHSHFVKHMDIARAMDKLADHWSPLCQIIELKYALFWKNRQIAAKLHLSPSTVGKYLDAALDFLASECGR